MVWPPFDLAVAVVSFLLSVKCACCRSRRMGARRRELLAAARGESTESIDPGAIRVWILGFDVAFGGLIRFSRLMRKAADDLGKMNLPVRSVFLSCSFLFFFSEYLGSCKLDRIHTGPASFSVDQKPVQNGPICLREFRSGARPIQSGARAVRSHVVPRLHAVAANGVQNSRSMILPREPSSPSSPPSPPTRRPLSILLGQQVYITDRRNGTTATSASSDGCTVEVSFWITDPPAVSYFSVHCPDSKSTAAEFENQPQVVGAEGQFVLLRALFASGHGEFEYFVCRAGDGGSASSLDLIKPPDDDDLFGAIEFSIVPLGNGGHYHLAALCDARASLDCELRVYSSEDERWRTKQLLNPLPGVQTILFDKVITLGEGVLGWVNFRQGMLVCNLLQEPPTARYIPLPELLPENRKKLESSQRRADLKCFRDLTCTNGAIKFIEMEHRIVIREIRDISTEKPSDPSLKDVLYDSDLIMSQKQKHVDRKPKKLQSMNGWRAVMWTRAIESNCWFKECAIDVDEILVDESAYSLLLSGQRDGSLGSLTFRSMYSAWPTLSMGGDDLFYLKSYLKLSGQNGRVVAVNLAKKALKVKAFGVSFMYIVQLFEY
uniref:DUF1618 domain-containing protein n=2 Tax=Setaria viridis TaxID=4556 RepID=A0A4U6TBM4_SETVI|nr:hypothetical protein SEVIR_9G527200v2 [Setaria viridis]